MVNRSNYHLVKGYLDHVRSVRQRETLTVERYESYLRHTLLWADEVPFSQVHKMAVTLPMYLVSLGETGGDRRLAPTTEKKIIQVTRDLLEWAKIHSEREFRSLPMGWIADLQAPKPEAGLGQRERIFVTEAETLQLAQMPLPEDDLVRRRDQAASAMLFLSGMRAGAFVTLPIEALDMTGHSIHQWPERGVQTKNNKKATTFLLPIPELLAVVERWDTFVRSQLPPTAMWYAPIDARWGNQRLLSTPAGKGRNGSLSKQMRLLFAVAEMEYRWPHLFRHGHAVWALLRAKTMADYKAVSMNLMHGDLKVTDGIYAPLLSDEVERRIAGLGGKVAAQPSDDRDVADYLRRLTKGQMIEALHILADEMAR